MFKSYTLFLIKSDVFQRELFAHSLVNISSLFNIYHFETRNIDENNIQLMREFYAEHKDRPFFEELMQNVSGQIGIGILSSESTEIITEFRKALGETDPSKSNPLTLRRRFGISIGLNSFHGSDSFTSFVREIKLLLPNIWINIINDLKQYKNSDKNHTLPKEWDQILSNI